MLADIGGGTTDIAVFKDNMIFHTSVIPVAGYQFTKDISTGTGLAYEMAEEMKKKYGNVTPIDEDAKDQSVPVPGNGHSVSYKDLNEIIRMRAEELIRLIMMELPREDVLKLIPSGIVLTGGAANLPGLAELAQGITRMPVRIGSPFKIAGVAEDMLTDPAYATAVGLLLWRSHNEGAQSYTEPKSGLSRFFHFGS
jgi:cell division protein FtsA